MLRVTIHVYELQSWSAQQAKGCTTTSGELQLPRTTGPLAQHLEPLQQRQPAAMIVDSTAAVVQPELLILRFQAGAGVACEQTHTQT